MKNADPVMVMNYRRRRRCCCHYYWYWQWTQPATTAVMRSHSSWPCSLDAVAAVSHLPDERNVGRPIYSPEAIETMRSASKVHLHRHAASVEAVLCQRQEDMIELITVFRWRRMTAAFACESRPINHIPYLRVAMLITQEWSDSGIFG